MNELMVFESLCPDTHPLTDSDRAAMRAELFGAATGATGPDRLSPPGAASAVATTAVADDRGRSDLTRDPASRADPGVRAGRRALVVAASVTVFLGLAGLWAASSNRNADQSPAPAQQPVTAPPRTDAGRATTPTGTAGTASTVQPAQTRTPSAEPTSFPVLEPLPPGLSATAHVRRIADQVTTPRTEALIGRRIDGVLTDAIQIMVQTQPFDITTATDRPPTDTVVMGQPATVYNRTINGGAPQVHVTWGSGPYFVASGADPLAFFERTDHDAIRADVASNPDQPPLLTFGSLPDGFELIASPRAVGQATLIASLSIGADNYDISVSTRNPLVEMPTIGPLRSIEVAGRPAWTFVSSFPSQHIAWQVDDSTSAYLKINGDTDAADALAFANSITFVSFDTWTSRYSPDEVNVLPTTEPVDHIGADPTREGH